MNQKRYGSMDTGMSPNMGSPDAGSSDAYSKQLADSITTNLYTINNGSQTLGQALKIIGTSRDNQVLRDKWHVTQVSVNQIIAQMSKDLQKFSALSRSGNKAQKLQSEKLVNNFKETLQAYSDLQNQVAQKMKANPIVNLITMEDENKVNQEVVENEKRQLIAQKQLQRDLEFENSLLLEDESRMRQIETDIIDVNSIMRDLGTLVHEQGRNVDTIEDHIDRTATDIEGGTKYLDQRYQYEVRRRKRNCCLLSVASISLVVLIIIVYISLR